jgi:dCMP deaminase
MTDRPSWDDWALGIAHAVAARADCTRRKIGAVILDSEHRIVSTGYNGSPPGGPSCLAGECPRGQHRRIPGGFAVDNQNWKPETCACGKWWPCREASEPGSSYDTGYGVCIALHAELNAILYADRERLDEATLYITDEPCDGCMKIIKGTRIKRVVTPEHDWKR